MRSNLSLPHLLCAAFTSPIIRPPLRNQLDVLPTSIHRSQQHRSALSKPPEDTAVPFAAEAGVIGRVCARSLGLRIPVWVGE